MVEAQSNNIAPEDDAVARFEGLTKDLHEDATYLFDQAKQDQSSRTRRNAVRAALASIEGLVSATKGMILEPLPSVRRHYTDAEVAMLREESYVLTDRGEAATQSRFVRLEDNVRFTWNMFVKEWGISPDIDYSSEGWRAFCSSIKIRNRITHPRLPAELVVSVAECATVERGYDFVYSMTMRNVFRSLQAARRTQYELMNRTLGASALHWLDGVGQIGPSPSERVLTESESHDLVRIDAASGGAVLKDLLACELLGSVEGELSLLQKGADYRAWRLQTCARAT